MFVCTRVPCVFVRGVKREEKKGEGKREREKKKKKEKRRRETDHRALIDHREERDSLDR